MICGIIVALFTGYVTGLLHASTFILKTLGMVQRHYSSLPCESAASFRHKVAIFMHRYVTYISICVLEEEANGTQWLRYPKASTHYQQH